MVYGRKMVLIGYVDNNFTAPKMKFSLRIYAANVTTSAVSYGFGYIY